MDSQTITIGLTVLALLGSMAGVLVGIFFRLGTFSGSVTTELKGIHEEQRMARTENNDAHAAIYQRLQADHEQTTEKLATVHGRLTALEERTGHGR